MKAREQVRPWLSKMAVLAMVASPAAAADDPHTIAAQLLGADGVRPGLVVHLGCGDATLTTELTGGGRNVVFGLSTDAAQVEQTRRSIEANGKYGPVSVDLLPGAHIPLADGLANLVVAPDFDALEKRGLRMAEVLRVLAPYGTAFLKNAGSIPADATVSPVGEWTRIVKPYPGEMDEWPQYHHDGSGMMLSADRLVGPVDGVRWISGGYWNGSMGDPVEIVSAGGRVFYANTTASRARPAVLEARDAFNGLTLWTRPIMPADYRPAQPRVIALGDKVYAPLVEEQERLGELDAATGRVLRSFPFKAADIEYINGTFLVDRGQQAWSVQTGEKRWELKIDDPPQRDVKGMAATFHPFVADDRQVYHLSGPSLLGHALATGRRNWQAPLQGRQERLLFCSDGRVITEESAPGPVASYSVPTPFVLRAYSAADGSFLWKYDFSCAIFKSRVRAFQPTPDELWCHTWRVVDGAPRPVPMFACLDARTGQEKKTVPTTINSSRCHPHRATTRFLFGADGAMFDVTDGRTHGEATALRGGCQFGFVPANGLLYQDLSKCLCYNSLRGAAAFAPGDTAQGGPGADENPLERGPAFSAAPSAAGAGDLDWPTLRHDVRRSASTGATLPSTLAAGWTAELPGQPSSPTAADGKVFVSLKDQHAVCALSAIDGAVLWHFTAGGRVDSPPTYADGRVLFGSADGWVYSVAASDGRLAWRFRAAPSDRRITVRGQVESAWPVHGAVLVENGVAYVSAGRHTGVDGGISVFALKTGTGEMIWQNRVSRDPVALNDVLVTDGNELYLDQLDLEKSSGQRLKKTAKEHVLTKALWGGALGLLNAEVLEPPYAGQAGGRKHWRYVGYDGHLLALDGDRIFGAVYEATAYGAEHTWRYGYRGWGSGEEGRLSLTGNTIFGTGPDGTWSQAFPADPEFRIKALIRAGDKVLAAVAPDRRDARRGELWIYAAADGKPLGQIALAAAPAFDGLAVADGTLVVATEARTVLCLRAPRD